MNDIDFRKNRLKYQNDPTMMKKLSIIASVKRRKDSGAFVICFAEFLGDGSIPSSDFDAEYHQKRCTIFLWNYGVVKARKGYASDNEVPQKNNRDGKN
ncbi:hypothetical protein P3S67_012404 [Capsicum chacoense]